MISHIDVIVDITYKVDISNQWIMKMTNTTITKTQNAPPVGEYIKTSVDNARAVADICITGYVRARTEIMTRKLLSGSGVKLIATINGVGRYLVTDEVMTELRRRYTISTDF